MYKSKVKENGQIIHSYPRKGKNCLVFPGDVKGVDFDFVGCTNPQYFRSTRQSIMNNERYFRKFNVVGCAHCVDAILKEDNKDPEDYFAKCESYNEEVYGNEFNGCVKRLSEEARDCVGEGQNEYCFDCIGEGNEGICSEPQEGRRCQINGVVGECDSGGKCITSIQSGEAEQNFCEDSEEGISLVDKGTVTTDWGVFEDYCEVPGGKYLTELSCGSSEGRVLLASERFDCTLGGAYEDEHGRCIRGVCVWS